MKTIGKYNTGKYIWIKIHYKLTNISRITVQGLVDLYKLL